MKKLLASALSCLMLFGVSTLLLTASAAITNQSLCQDNLGLKGYIESPYDVLDYSDVLKVHEIRWIDRTAPVNNDSTVTGNLL